MRQWTLIVGNPGIYIKLKHLLFVLPHRGFVYCRNEEMEAGWVAHSSGFLLHRPASFDTKPHQLCQVIDPFTLQVQPLSGNWSSFTLHFQVYIAVVTSITITVPWVCILIFLIRIVRRCLISKYVVKWNCCISCGRGCHITDALWILEY